MSVEIRCAYGSSESWAAVRQMDDVFGPSFARLLGEAFAFSGFGKLAIFLSIAHPVSPMGPDNRRGSYNKPTDTYFSSAALDYADWIACDWRSRVLGYGEAVNTAIMRIAKTRLTDAERLIFLDVNERTIVEVLASAPEVVEPLQPVCLAYYEGSDRPGVHFGPILGAGAFSPPGIRYVEVKPEDAFSALAALPAREEMMPSIPRLFRRDKEGLHFYEAFPDKGRIIEYEGLCGVGGENRFHDFEIWGQAEKVISRLKAQAKAKGFRAISMSKHKRLIIEYPVTESFADADELDIRHTLEDFLDDQFGRLGLGHCDGGSTGQGTMEVCCFVVDFKLAKAAIEPILAKSKFKAYSRIYLET